MNFQINILDMKPEEIYNNDGEIDIKVVLRFLNRYKYKILGSTFIGLTISYFSQIRAPKIWKGQFQIVLNSNTGQSINQVNAI